jgi:hypothetical protein
VAISLAIAPGTARNTPASAPLGQMMTLSAYCYARANEEQVDRRSVLVSEETAWCVISRFSQGSPWPQNPFPRKRRRRGWRLLRDIRMLLDVRRLHGVSIHDVTPAEFLAVDHDLHSGLVG